MIVKDERDSYASDLDYMNECEIFNVSIPENKQGHFIRNDESIRNHARVRNKPTNYQLQEDLVEEIRNQFGGEEINSVLVLQIELLRNMNYFISNFYVI